MRIKKIQGLRREVYDSHDHAKGIAAFLDKKETDLPRGIKILSSPDLPKGGCLLGGRGRFTKSAYNRRS